MTISDCDMRSTLVDEGEVKVAEDERHYGGFPSHSLPTIQHFFIRLLLFKSLTLRLGIMRVMNLKAEGRVGIVSHLSFCAAAPTGVLYQLRFRSVTIF